MSADSEPPSSAKPEPVDAASPDQSVAPSATRSTGEEANAPDYLPQKRRHKKPETPEFDFSAGTDDEILILGTLLQRLLARKQAEAGEPEGGRAKVKRFAQREAPPFGAAPTAAAEGDDSDGDAAVATTEGDAPSPKPTSAPPTLPKLTPRMTSPTGEDYWSRPSRSRGVLYFVFCAGLAVIAFLVGRGASKPSIPPGVVVASTTPAPHWNATLLGKLDQVLAADQSGDLKGANAQALDLKKQIGNSLELDLYLGSLTTRLGHVNDAEADLSRLMDPYMQPLQAAAVNDAMAFTYSRRREFKRAAEAFADASRINPFEPNNYYRWGEVLRRQGRFQDAIDKFRQALQRLPEGEAESESQRDCADFKLRLAQIELGRDADVKPAIDSHLKDATPGGYWLLTAAAFALQHGNMPAATDALQKARATLPPGQYSALIDDYFFHAFAEQRPELAAVLPVPSAEAKQKQKARMVYFVDP